MADSDNSALPREAPRASSPLRGLLSVLAIVLAIAACVGWLASHRAQQDLQARLTRDVAEANAAAAKAVDTQADLASGLRDAQAKLALLEARLAESQSQQEVLENFYRDISPARDDLTLTEVEQTVNLAAQQLALAGNVQSALVALQLADNKLAQVNRPRFMPLRRALAADMDRLKAVPFVDVGLLAGKIDSAIAAVDTLPLARDERSPAPSPVEPAAAESGWRLALADAWAHVAGLVRIESSDRPAAPLLLPSEEYFLRENLRLRLLSARNALLARNDASFKADVRDAEAWIRKYFDIHAKPVQAVNATLAQLAAVAMPATLPEVSRTLAALTSLHVAQDRVPARPQDKPATSTSAPAPATR